VEETFTRLYFYGHIVFSLSDAEFWTLPLGEFLDLWTCYKQFNGIEKPHREAFIDDIIAENLC
jgi:hypothetical protein